MASPALRLQILAAGAGAFPGLIDARHYEPRGLDNFSKCRAVLALRQPAMHWSATHAMNRHRDQTCGKLGPVGKHEELRLRILQGKSDANVDFDELCRLLQYLGFEQRTRGSHHVFRKHGVRELINL